MIWLIRIKKTHTHRKKSSLQKTSLSRTKHLSFRASLQCAHFKHFECQLLSNTFKINRSRIRRPHPVHLGMVAVRDKRKVSIFQLYECIHICFFLLIYLYWMIQLSYLVWFFPFSLNQKSSVPISKSWHDKFQNRN